MNSKKLDYYNWGDNDHVFVISLGGYMYRYLKGIDEHWEFVDFNSPVRNRFDEKACGMNSVSKEYFVKNNIPLLSLEEIIKDLEKRGHDLSWFDSSNEEFDPKDCDLSRLEGLKNEALALIDKLKNDMMEK